MTAGGAGGAVLGVGWAIFFPLSPPISLLGQSIRDHAGGCCRTPMHPGTGGGPVGTYLRARCPQRGDLAQLGALGLAVPTSLPGTGGPSMGTSLPRDVRSSPAPRCLPAVALCYSNSGFMARTCLK